MDPERTVKEPAPAAEPRATKVVRFRKDPPLVPGQVVVVGEKEYLADQDGAVALDSKAAGLLGPAWVKV